MEFNFLKFIQKYFFRGVLVLMPIVLYFAWYAIEYKTIPIQEIEPLEGRFYTIQEFQELLQSKNIEREIQKENFPHKIDFNEQLSNIDFKDATSKKFLDKLGIFSFLPTHKICLKNNNVIFVENEQNYDFPDTVGAIGIVQSQQADPEFYVERNGSPDCKTVFKDRFKQSQSRLELSYVIISEIGHEDIEKLQAGRGFQIYVKAFRIDTTDSSLTRKLHPWTFLPFYPIVLLLISYPFFQVRKIYIYVRMGEY